MAEVPNVPSSRDWRWMLRTLGLALIMAGMPSTLQALGIWNPYIAYIAGGVLGIFWMVGTR